MSKRTSYSTDPEDDLPSPFDVLRDFRAERADAKPPPERVPEARDAHPAAANPHVQAGHPVRVSRERRGRGGKTVSIITGVQGSQARQNALLKLLKQRLGTGGSLKPDCIEIQGEQRERIVEILVELGYPARVAGG